MSTELLERASVALGPLAREVVFVGGATIGLWATDPAAPPARPTRDVDVIVEIAGLGQYSALGERLRARAFREDVESGIICRWRRGDDLILDVMPTDEAILGFSNSWFAPAFESAIDVTLPSGAVIRVVRPPYLVATKIEAFRRRGHGDYVASVDFEDIVRLVDTREELVGEVTGGDPALAAFIREALRAMSAEPLFASGVSGALLPDFASQGRAALVLERFRRLT